MTTEHNIKPRNIFLDPVKPWARIEDWYLTTTPHGHRVLVGKITEHPRHETFSLEYQITSPVLSYNPEENEAETENTMYRLGVPAASSKIAL